MTYTLVLDKLMLMGTTRTEVRVISERAQEIREAILAEMDRGVTMLSGETGYLKQETQMIFSVISNREVPKIEKLIHTIDPESFMVSKPCQRSKRPWIFHEKAVQINFTVDILQSAVLF